jgi:hypothetical protein
MQSSNVDNSAKEEESGHVKFLLDFSHKLKQLVTSQVLAGRELTHGVVATEVHKDIKLAAVQQQLESGTVGRQGGASL